MLINYLKIYLITLFLAVAYTLLVFPLQVLDGGTMGIAMILHYLFDWNTGTVYFLINAPIFLWAFFFDRTLFYRSVFGMFSLSLNMYLIAPFEHLVQLNGVPAFLLSSFLLGFGYWALGAAKSSVGGFAMIGVKLEELKILRLSTVVFITDFAVVMAGGLFFGWRKCAISIVFVAFLAFGIELAAAATRILASRRRLKPQYDSKSNQITQK